MATMRERIIRARLDRVEQEGADHEIALIEVQSVQEELGADRYLELVAQHEAELIMCDKRRVALLQALEEVIEQEQANGDDH